MIDKNNLFFPNFQRSLRIPSLMHLYWLLGIMAVLLLVLEISFKYPIMRPFFSHPLPELSLEAKKEIYLGSETPNFEIVFPEKSLKSNFKIKELKLVNDRNKEQKISADYQIISSSRDSNLKFNLNWLPTFHPGLYHLSLVGEIKKKEVILEDDFLWGVVAVNLRRSVALSGIVQDVQIAVLDNDGRTICNSQIEATVTNPKGGTQIFSTKDGTIRANPECRDRSVTNDPDYFFPYLGEEEGEYKLELTADTRDGIRIVTDYFSLQKEIPFDIERTEFPTRIYPVASYPVYFTIIPDKNFSGLVTETVPKDFVISNISSEGRLKEGKEDNRTIEWQVDWEKDNRYLLGYEFDAPNISPYLYRLGPLTLWKNNEKEVFQEFRQWQIASDNTCQSNATGNWSAASSWTNCGGTTPQLADTVTILNGHTITLDTSPTIQTIDIQSGGALTSTGIPTLTLTATSGTLFTLGGSFTPGSNSTVAMNSDGTPILTSGVITFNNLDIKPTIMADRIQNFGSGALTINGIFTIRPTASSVYSLTVNLGADITVASTGYISIIRGNSATATLDTTASNYSVTVGYLNVSTGGTFNANGSVITLNGSSVTNLLYVSGGPSGTGGIFNAGSSTINLTGTATNMLYLYSLMAPVTFNAGSSTINFTGSASNSMFYNQGSTFNAGSSTMNFTGTATDYFFVNSGTFNSDTSTVNINSDSTPSSYAIYGYVTFNNLNLTPTITADRTYPTIGAFSVNEDFNINPTASSAYRLTVTMGGNITVASTKTTTITGTTSGLSTVTTSTYTLSTGLLSIGSAGTLDASGGGLTLTGTGSIYSNSGTFTTNTSTVLTIKTDQDYTLDFGTRDIGNLTLSPTITANRIYNFSGPAPLTIYGNLLIQPNASSVYSLTVNLAYDLSMQSSKYIQVTRSGSATATLDTTASNYSVTVDYLDVYTGGTFNANGSVITLNGSSVTNLLYVHGGVSGTAGIFNAGSSTINLTGTATNNMLCLSSYMAPATFNAGSSTINFTGSASNSMFYNQGSTFNAGSSTMNFTGTATDYIIYNNGTFNGDTSTVNINSDSTPSSYAIYGVYPVAFNNLNLTPTITDDRTYSIYTSYSTITVNGDFNVNPTASSAYRLTVTMGGNITVASTKTTTITGTTSGLSTVTTSTYTLSTGLLSIGSAGTLDASGGGLTLTGTGSIYSNSGTFTTNSSTALTIQTDQDYTLDFGTRDIGNLTLSPTITANRIYNFSGPAPLTIYGNLLIQPNASSVYSLTVNLAYDLSMQSSKYIQVTRSGSATATLDTTASNYSVTVGYLDVYTGGTFNANGSVITLNGSSVTNLLYVHGGVTGTAGIFNAGSSTINLTGTATNMLYLYTMMALATFNAESSTMNFTGTGTSYIFYNNGGIFNGDTSTVNINSDSTPSSYAIYGGSTFNNLNLTPTITADRAYPTSGTITINGDFNVNPTASSAYRLTVTMGGNITIASTKTTTITGTTSGLSTVTTSTYTLSTGLLSIGSAGTLNASDGGLTLTGTGSIYSNSGTFTTNTSTVLTIQTDQDYTLDFGTRDIGNLTLNPTITANRIYNFSGTAPLTIYGNLLIQPNASSTLSLTVNLAYDLSMQSSKYIQVYRSGSYATATLDTTASNYNITAGKLSLSRTTFNANGSTITLNGTSDRLLSSYYSTFNAGSSTINLTGSASNSMFYPYGGTFNAESSTMNFTGTGTSYIIDNHATFNGQDSTVNINSDCTPSTYAIYASMPLTFNNLNLTPTITADRTYSTSGAFSVNGDFNINPTASSAYRLTVTMGGNITVASTKTTTITGTTSGLSTLNVNGYTLSTGLLTINSAGTLNGGSLSTIRVTGTNGDPFTNNGTFTASTLYFHYDGNNPSGNTTVESNATYYALYVNSSSETYVLEGTTNATYWLSITGALDTTASNHSITTGRIILNSSGTLTANGSIITLNGTSPLFSRIGTFNANSSTIKMNSTASVTLTSGTVTFYNLTIDNASQTGTLGSTITVNGNLAIDNGTLADGGYQITGNATYNMTMAAGTYLTLGTASTATSFPTNFTAGHISLNATSTVTYNSNSAQTISGVPTYGHLTLAATGAVNKTAGAAITCAGNFTIGANNTFITSNYAFNLGGNFANNGAFTAGASGTVTLNGSSQQTVSGTLTGASAFQNLTITNASGADDPGCGTSFTPGVIFSGSVTINGTYTITTDSVRVQYNSGSTYTVAAVSWNGQATGSRIFFRNSTLDSGTWLLTASGSPVASYVNVMRSDASSGSAIDASNGTNYDCGFNTNWTWPVGFNISGTIYGTDESAPVLSGPTVRVKVNGLGDYSTTASAVDGTYTVSSVPMSAGDSLTIYLDTDGGITGSVFTVSTGAEMANIDLYQDRATARCDNSCSLTNTNIDYWDKDDDGDIHAAVSTGNLTVDNDWKLLVKANTYAPAGTVTLSTGGSNSYSGNVEIKSGATLDMNGNALSVSGSWNNSGTFTSGSNTTTFTSTTINKTLAGTMTSSSAFYNLTFDGVGGTWSISNDVTATNDFTITNGTLTAPSGTLSVGGSYSNSGTFTNNSGLVKFTATTGSKTLSGTMTSSSAFYDLTFEGGVSGAWTFNNDATVSNDFTITVGTVEAPSGTLTISGSYDNNSAFTHNSGTVLFNASATGKTIEAGGSTFYNVTFNNASGGWTIQTDDFTTEGNFTLTDASSFTVDSGRTVEVQGDFSNAISGANTTWTGSTLYLNGSAGAMKDINSKTQGGDTYITLRIGAEEDVAMWDSSASTFTIDAGGCLFSEDHGGTAGQLNIYGTCNSRSNEYWSYATDFDGAALGGASRQADVRFASGTTMTVDNGDSLQILGDADVRTLITRQSSGNYSLTINGTIDARYYDFDYLDASGLNIASTATVSELSDGSFDNVGAGASSSYITVTGITSTEEFLNNVFDNPEDGADGNVVYNVNADGSGINWTFKDYSGNKGGEDYDREVNGAFIFWGELPTLTFTLSDNTMEIGTLNPSVIGSDNHTITVTTNATNGYTCRVVEDGNLRDGSNDINDVADGSVTAGSEEYGFSCSGTDCQLSGDNAISGSPLTVASHTGPVTGQATTMTYKAAVSASTPPGNYSHIVTYTCTGDF